jgi:type IV pilus assembly protein PilW
MIASTYLSGRARTVLQRGFTLVELMVGMALGLLVLAVATAVFVNVSGTRHDTVRVGRQIENGRYAVQLLADDLVNAGYFGEFDPRLVGLPGATPDPCSIDVAKMKTELMVHVQGYGPAETKPTCITDVRPNTSVVAVRRVATCVAGEANCDPVTAGDVYFQSSLCNTELAAPQLADRYSVAAAPGASGTFALTRRNCATTASLRRYVMNIYFVANNNNTGDGIPTLKRAELANGAFTVVPLVEGIENLQVEYGLDTSGDGAPDVLTVDPGSYGGCAAAACYVAHWANVMTARVHVLSRTTEPTPGHKDVKTFTLGPVTVAAANDSLKRHAYSETVRMNNPAGRRE